MDSAGMCDLCGKALSKYSCSLCGKRVCGNCVTVRGVCKACLGGTQMDDVDLDSFKPPSF